MVSVILFSRAIRLKIQQWGANNTWKGIDGYDCILKFYLLENK